MDLASTLGLLNPKNIAQSDRNVIREMWDLLAGLPGGRKIFSHAVGLAAPYTATIDAKVEVLRKGYAEVRMIDKPKLRNHLASVHAVALANLVELTGNIALAYSLPDDARFIVAGMDVEYKKKARGTLRATCECPVPTTGARQEYVIDVSVWNMAGEEVAHGKLRSLVGPKKKELS